MDENWLDKHKLTPSQRRMFYRIAECLEPDEDDKCSDPGEGEGGKKRIKLTADDLEGAEWGLNDLIDEVRSLQAQRDRLIERELRAFRAIRDGKGKARLYEAARIMGWIAPNGRTPKYPPIETLLLERQFVALTSATVPFILGDEVAIELDMPDLGLQIGECPLSPSGAIKVLAKLHNAASEESLLRELWRRRERLEQQRAELIAAGDEAAARELLELKGLPQCR